MKPLLCITPLLACLAATPNVSAAERMWDGDDVTGNWTVGANWDGNAALNLANDDLNFPTGVAGLDKLVNNNYAANTVFRTLNFLDGGYLVGGAAMGLTNGVTGFFPSGTVTLNTNFTLQNTQTFAVNGGGDLTFGGAGQISLNGFTLNFQPIHADSVISVDGALTGTGNSAIRVTGAGVTNFNGAKAFTGNVRIENGAELNIDNAGGLGTGAGVTTLDGGTLVLDSVLPLTISETIQMVNEDPEQSYLISRGGAHTVTGGIEFTGDHFKRFEVEGTSLTLSGVVSGPEGFGSLSKAGTGRLILSGAQSNTFGIQIFRAGEGEVYLNKTGGATAVTSPFVSLGFNGNTPDNAILRLGGNNQIADSSWMDIASDGWFDLNGYQETIEHLKFLGPGRITGGGGALRITSDVWAFSAAEDGGTAVISSPVILSAAESEWEVYGGDLNLKLTVNGNVTSTAPGGVLKKTGEGTLEINGNINVPLLKQTAGNLVLSGNSPATNLEMNIGGGGADSLDIKGTIGHLNLWNGSFQGQNWGTIEEVTCNDLTLGYNVTCHMTLRNSTPGEHDVIHVQGDGRIDDAIFLVQTLAPFPAIGAEVVMIEKSGTETIYGEFSNLLEGQVMIDMVASYHGGDGNDFTLTRILSTGVTRTWDGGGTDNNWSTAANWNPNGTPNPGDDLVFPVTALRKTNTNDFPAGTTFNTITVQGVSYNMGGNMILLNRQLNFTATTGANTFSAPLKLAASSRISVEGDCFVQVTGNVDTNNHLLRLINNGDGGPGDLYMSGIISGSGDVVKMSTGDVTLLGANTYTGVTYIYSGLIALTPGATFGSPLADSYMQLNGGATLELRNNTGDVVTQETIILYGTVRDTGGAHLAQLAGPLKDLHGYSHIETLGEITMSGPISGVADAIKVGPGRLILNGTQPNTWTGEFWVIEGEVVAAKASGNALPENIRVGQGGNTGGRITLGGNNQFPDHAEMWFMYGPNVLDIGGWQDRIKSVFFHGGTITGTPAGLLTLEKVELAGGQTPVVISVPLSAPAGMSTILDVPNGMAVPDLQLDGALYGATFEKLNNGRVDVMTGIPQAGLDVMKITLGEVNFFANCRYTNIELAGGTVGGQGTVGNMAALPGGVVSPGTNTTTGGFGGYTAVWNAATTARFQLNGLSPGSEFDQYAAFGPLTLGGSKLDLTVGGGFEPAAGAEFMIVRNVSGQLVSGIFGGIPEGGYVSAPGAKVFQITYHGGDGDDVVLTKVDTAPPVIILHGMTPGTGPHINDNDTGMTVKGTPGLAYRIESSKDLVTWTVGESKVADLETGLMEFEFFNPKSDPRIFLRVRLP